MENLKKDYSVLGGVVAPKSSAYVMLGMSNPLAQKPTKPLDTSLPSLRDTGGVSVFNDFNPYNQAPRKNSEMVRNEMSMRTKRSNVRYMVDVNTFQPMGSPILSRSIDPRPTPTNPNPAKRIAGTKEGQDYCGDFTCGVLEGGCPSYGVGGNCNCDGGKCKFVASGMIQNRR